MSRSTTVLILEWRGGLNAHMYTVKIYHGDRHSLVTHHNVGTSNLLQPRRFQLRAIMQLRERNEILLPRPSTQTSAPRPIELDGVQYLTTEEPGHGSILFAPLLGRWEHRPARSRRTVAPAPRPRRRRIVPPICPRVRPQPRARTRRAASAVPECPPLLESGTGWFVLPRGPFISCVIPIPPSCG